MGCPSSIPVYIAPAAMAKLGHPLGEINLTRGAGATGIIQGVSLLMSGGGVWVLVRDGGGGGYVLWMEGCWSDL